MCGRARRATSSPTCRCATTIRLPATVRRTQVGRKHDVDGLLRAGRLTETREAQARHAVRRRTAACGDRRGALQHSRDPAGRTNRRPSWTRSRRLECSSPSGPSPRVPRRLSSWDARPRGREKGGTPDPGARTAAYCTKAIPLEPIADDGRSGLPTEAVWPHLERRPEAEVTADEVTASEADETGHA